MIKLFAAALATLLLAGCTPSVVRACVMLLLLLLAPLLRRDGNILHVSHVDMLDGTPLLDIKPSSPDLDSGSLL